MVAVHRVVGSGRVLGLQAAQAQLQEAIKIGGPISLSGKYAKEGQQTIWGVQAVVK